MARFRGTIQGNRGQTSRLGSAYSGLLTETNGWNFGIRVRTSTVGDEDIFEVFQTGGSNGGYNRRIAKYTINPRGGVVTGGPCNA